MAKVSRAGDYIWRKKQKNTNLCQKEEEFLKENHS
jgi:hypothetical protein